MLRRKHVLVISILFIFIFLVIIVCSTYALNKLDKREVKNVKTTENVPEEIRSEFLQIKSVYKNRQKSDLHSDIFLKSLRASKETFSTQELKDLWFRANNWVADAQIFNITDSNLGNVIKALRTAQIIHADVDSRGSQLKILVELEGGQKAVFKPQWYDKEEIIIGPVYAGNDRYGAEILSFYISGLLDLPLTPLAAERIISLKDDIVPVATKTLSNTIFEQDGKMCVYGKCFYCKKEKPVCEKRPGVLKGAIILHIPGKLITYRSPWQRTYKKDKKALWETLENYCSRVKNQLSSHRLLDLIDTAIFDFLIQNGDRHHYETLHDKVILLDNGKGLGNPNAIHYDILAPLYQCCRVRKTTVDRLKQLSGGLLLSLLQSIPEVTSVVTEAHLKAIDKRLLIIFATIEKCKKEKKMLYT